MNKALMQLNTLFINGKISKEEYDESKKWYILCKTSADEFEKATEKRYHDLVVENIVNSERERVKKYMYDRKKDKIYDLYANGVIDEDDMRKMLDKLNK